MQPTITVYILPLRTNKKVVQVAQFKAGEYRIGKMLLQLPDELEKKKKPNQIPELNRKYMPKLC